MLKIFICIPNYKTTKEPCLTLSCRCIKEISLVSLTFVFINLLYSVKKKKTNHWVVARSCFRVCPINTLKRVERVMICSLTVCTNLWHNKKRFDRLTWPILTIFQDITWNKKHHQTKQHVNIYIFSSWIMKISVLARTMQSTCNKLFSWIWE